MLNCSKISKVGLERVRNDAFGTRKRGLSLISRSTLWA